MTHPAPWCSAPRGFLIPSRVCSARVSERGRAMGWLRAAHPWRAVHHAHVCGASSQGGWSEDKQVAHEDQEYVQWFPENVPELLVEFPAADDGCDGRCIRRGRCERGLGTTPPRAPGLSAPSLGGRFSPVHGHTHGGTPRRAEGSHRARMCRSRSPPTVMLNTAPPVASAMSLCASHASPCAPRNMGPASVLELTAYTHSISS